MNKHIFYLIEIQEQGNSDEVIVKTSKVQSDVKDQSVIQEQLIEPMQDGTTIFQLLTENEFKKLITKFSKTLNRKSPNIKFKAEFGED